MDFEKKKENNIPYYIFITLLVILLIVVIFYVLFVHIPYNQHEASLDEARTAIIEKDKLNDDHYFYEYNRSHTYYIIRAKIKGKSTYLAYSQKYKLVDKYTGTIVSKKTIRSKIVEKYKVEPTLDNIKVGYEDDSFRYVAKYQNDHYLYYFYYTMDGKFIKEYRL